MAKAHGRTKTQLEEAGADPNTDDSEGSPPEDSWLGRGAHGWFDRLVRRWGKQPTFGAAGVKMEVWVIA